MKTLSLTLTAVALSTAVCFHLSAEDIEPSGENPIYKRGATQMESILPPSPEPASAVKYVDVPFNHSQGLAQLDIPFYTLKGRELNIPIGLSYASGGIKMDEIAGVAGLGWSLQAGGCVTRSVCDMPDEFSFGVFEHRMPTASLLSDLENGVNNTQTFDYIRNVTWHRLDSSLDRYSYSVCGLSGSFVIKDDGSIAQLVGDGVEISCARTASGGVDSFTITGPDGTVYVLSEKETGHHDGRSDHGPSPMTGQQDYWEATTTWHLTSVTSRSGLESAEFNYVSGGLWRRDFSTSNWSLTFINDEDADTLWDAARNVTYIASSTDTKFLSSITLAGFTADFSYTGNTGKAKHTFNERPNCPRRLTEIRISAPGDANFKKMAVGTGKDSNDGRIILNRLDIYTGNALDDRWTFTYDTRNEEVCWGSQDWFGYYNAECEDTSGFPIHDGSGIHIEPGILPGGNEGPINPGEEWGGTTGRGHTCPFNVKAGRLISLDYGTPDASQASYMSLLVANHDGAGTTFTYEGNTIQAAGHDVSVGVRVKSITVSDNGTPFQTRTFAYDDPRPDGPAYPLESMFATVSPPYSTADMLENINNVRLVDQRTWVLTIHENPVGSGPSIRDTRVMYGKVTETTFDPSQPDTPAARTIRYFSTESVRPGTFQTILRFPNEARLKYNDDAMAFIHAFDPWTGIRTGYVDSGPASPALLTREEVYDCGAQEPRLASSTDYTYTDTRHSSVLVDYSATQVWQRFGVGNIQYEDIYHYPVYASCNFGRQPSRKVTVEYHLNGNDTTAVDLEYVTRGFLSKPVRLKSVSTEEGGVTRKLEYTYPDTWYENTPAWAGTLASQHCIAEPVKTQWSVGPTFTVHKTETMEFGEFSLSGSPHLLPSAHREFTDGNESWRETVLTRDCLGNVSSVKEKGRPETVIIWSWAGLYPAAVIENATMADVTAALGGQQAVDAITTAQTPSAAQLAALDALRTAASLNTAHVTTWTFIPGVGAASNTNPAGIVTAYEYDTHHRLERTRDLDGNAVEEWTYSLLNNGDGRLSMRHILFRDEDGTDRCEDIRWWNTLGLVTQDIALGASGDGRDLVTAYGSDCLLHDDARIYLPYPAQTGEGDWQEDACEAAPQFHGNQAAFSTKNYEKSSRDRVVSTALPGYAGQHEDSTAFNAVHAFPNYRWEGDAVVNHGTYGEGELVARTVKDADGRRLTTILDHAGRTLGTAFGDDEPSYYIYDIYDRLRAVAGSGTALTDTLGMWRYSYDSLDRVSSKGIPGCVREHYTYDDEDRVIALRRADELRETAYDAFGRPLTVHLTSGTGPRTLVEEHFYDAYPQQASTLMGAVVPVPLGSVDWNGPSKGLETFSRHAEMDADGVKPALASTLLLYDRKGRPVISATLFPDGGMLSSEMEYDFSGNVTSTRQAMTKDGRTDSLTVCSAFDRRGRMTACTSAIRADEDVPGRMAAPLPASVRSDYSYDALGRPCGVSSQSSRFHTLSEADTYTLQGWTASHSVSLDSGTLFTQELSYDNAASAQPSYTGKVTGVSDSWASRFMQPVSFVGYSYDHAGRLAEETTLRSRTDYTYDGRGNILAVDNYEVSVGHGLVQPEAQLQTWERYTYDGDRLATHTVEDATSATSTQLFTHDNLGRMTLECGTDSADTLLALSYNSLDLIARATAPDGISVNYSYLSDGTKTSAVTDAGTGLIYRGPFTYRTAADGTLSLESAAVPQGRLTPGKALLYVRDHLGSVRAVVDASEGKLLEASDYGSWGDRTGASVYAQFGNIPAGVSLRDRFTGKEDQAPEFGIPLSDHGARMYSSTLRRWTTADPLSEKYYGISPYAYCANDPVNIIDPQGDTCVVLLASKAVAYCGHMALLIQQEDGKYALYSKNGNKNSSSSKQNDLGEKIYTSPQEFLNTNQKGYYTDGIIIPTDQTTDNALCTSMEIEVKNKYHLLNSNCAQAVVNSLDANGIKVTSDENTNNFSIVPNPIFNQIRKANPTFKTIKRKK